MNSLGALGKLVCPMTYSISHDQWDTSCDDSDYDDSSEYDGIGKITYPDEDMSCLGSTGSDYSEC